MAEFDNGLPPEGIDISDKKISAVLIDKAEAEEADAHKISAVLINKSEPEEAESYKISAVLIGKEPAGRNRSMFL